MKIEFLEEAQLELDQAVEYYDLESPGLGKAFLQEVLNSLDRIASFKGRMIWPERSNCPTWAKAFTREKC